MPHFWSTVFQNSGLIKEQADIEILNNLTDFKCEYLSPKENELRLTFTFKEGASLFDNKVLEVLKKEG
jgi:hypothetical protein